MASESNSNMVKIDAALSGKAEQSRSVEITLTADGWTSDAAAIFATGCSSKSEG